ncbi:hypothetical protein F3Y22_tig00110450pilonHSYRG01128 [Hibiscus syriacus]|uniref:Reverse transcriptase zinc-binding domain-containing protein n=1 Tax=Hibiscus syriacus TaxID=106335 RepID=A0A6A3AJ69_HIBSY|nr:hypothetical protein F3Y22_tig00110450pilonHSYRG01128 [Hibiscus syriacus]
MGAGILDKLENLFDNNIVQYIRAIPSPDDDMGMDQPTWVWGDTSICSVKSTFTTIQRARRRLTSDAHCPICGYMSETVIHVLRDCSAARSVWNKLFPPVMLPSFFSSFVEVWLKENLNESSLFDCMYYLWRHMFGIIIWRLWKQRNTFIFNGEVWPSSEVLLSSRSWARTLRNQRQELSRVGGISYQVRQWRPPINGVVRLNSDGAVNQGTMKQLAEESYEIVKVNGCKAFIEILVGARSSILNYGQFWMGLIWLDREV